MRGEEHVLGDSRFGLDWENPLNKIRNTGWRIGVLVKYKGFEFDYAEFKVLPWTMWSLEELTDLETPIWKPAVSPEQKWKL